MGWAKFLTFAFSVLALSASAEGFHYADLEKLIRDHHVTTVDALLPLLPEDYRRYYIFVYQSRSQQKDNAFPEHPRTILYGGDAKFLIAFTKSPKEAPVVNIDDTIETIDFDDTNGKFNFRILTFHEGKDPLSPAPAVNPSTCLACHGNDPRPNWDSYNVWPGVYGSVSRLGCDTAADKSPEKAFYEAFQKNARHQGRYKNLPEETNDSSCPNKDDITIANAAVADPSADLTEKLFELNGQRLRRMVRENPRFSTFQYLWVGASQGCWERDPESFFPPDYAKNHGLPSYAQTLDDVINTGKLDFKRRLTRFLQTNTGSPTESARQPINFLDPNDGLGGSFSHRYQTQQLKFLAERTGFNMAIDRWATAFTDGTLDYATPHSSPGALLGQILSGLTLHLECEDLQKKSVEAIAALH